MVSGSRSSAGTFTSLLISFGRSASRLTLPRTLSAFLMSASHHVRHRIVLGQVTYEVKCLLDVQQKTFDV